MYENKLKDYENAEKYYLLATENKDIDAMQSLAFLYFQQYKNPKEALELMNNTISNKEDSIIVCLRVILLLWNSKIKEAGFLMKELLKKSDNYIEENIKLFLAVLFYFLVFKQKQILYKFFSENIILKDMLKPLYFALLTELKDEKQKEYLTMPPELQEPVEILLKEIDEQRNKFGI